MNNFLQNNNNNNIENELIESTFMQTVLNQNNI